MKTQIEKLSMVKDSGSNQDSIYHSFFNTKLEQLKQKKVELSSVANKEVNVVQLRSKQVSSRVCFTKSNQEAQREHRNADDAQEGAREDSQHDPRS